MKDYCKIGQNIVCMKDVSRVEFDFTEEFEVGYFCFYYTGGIYDVRNTCIKDLNASEYNNACREIENYFDRALPKVIEQEPKHLKPRTNVKSSTMGVYDVGVTDTESTWHEAKDGIRLSPSEIVRIFLSKE